MKNILTILASSLALIALAAPLECYKTQTECNTQRDQRTLDQRSTYYCFVSPNPSKCSSDRLAEYEAKETAKYKARNGGQNPPANYFLYSTATIAIGNSQSGSVNTGAMAVLGTIVLIFIGWAGYMKFKK